MTSPIWNSMAMKMNVGWKKGREGKGREGNGREGKGREGKGREGRGREGKGREGICKNAKGHNTYQVNLF